LLSWLSSKVSKNMLMFSLRLQSNDTMKSCKYISNFSMNILYSNQERLDKHFLPVTWFMISSQTTRYQWTGVKENNKKTSVKIVGGYPARNSNQASPKSLSTALLLYQTSCLSPHVLRKLKTSAWILRNPYHPLSVVQWSSMCPWMNSRMVKIYWF
jgi:hypothetical protein